MPDGPLSRAPSRTAVLSYPGSGRGGKENLWNPARGSVVGVLGQVCILMTVGRREARYEQPSHARARCSLDDETSGSRRVFGCHSLIARAARSRPSLRIAVREAPFNRLILDSGNPIRGNRSGLRRPRCRHYSVRPSYVSPDNHGS